MEGGDEVRIHSKNTNQKNLIDDDAAVDATEHVLPMLSSCFPNWMCHV